MRLTRLILATFLMMIARIFKILTVAVAPKDVKKQFQDII